MRGGHLIKADVELFQREWSLYYSSTNELTIASALNVTVCNVLFVSKEAVASIIIVAE